MQYQLWKRSPDNARQCAVQAEYDLWEETSCTASQVGYGDNVKTNEEIVDAEQKYLKSLQQFGETNNHTSATFEHLSKTNPNLVNNMAAAIQQLNHQVNGLAKAVQEAQI
jgi:hypothetical protein